MKDNYRIKLIFSALTMLLMLLSSSLVAQNLIIHGNFDDNLGKSLTPIMSATIAWVVAVMRGIFILAIMPITMETNCLIFLTIPQAMDKRDT